MTGLMNGTPFIAAPSDRSWRIRALIATKGNQSRLGCILIAVLGRTVRNPPRIRGNAIITKDGRVLADMQLQGRLRYLATDLGHIQEVVDNFRGLADAIKCTDAERIEMFDELRKWISRDFRAASNEEDQK